MSRESNVCEVCPEGTGREYILITAIFEMLLKERRIHKISGDCVSITLILHPRCVPTQVHRPPDGLPLAPWTAGVKNVACPTLYGSVLDHVPGISINHTHLYTLPNLRSIFELIPAIFQDKILVFFISSRLLFWACGEFLAC